MLRIVYTIATTTLLIACGKKELGFDSKRQIYQSEATNSAAHHNSASADYQSSSYPSRRLSTESTNAGNSNTKSCSKTHTKPVNSTQQMVVDLITVYAKLELLLLVLITICKLEVVLYKNKTWEVATLFTTLLISIN